MDEGFKELKSKENKKSFEKKKELGLKGLCLVFKLLREYRANLTPEQKKQMQIQNNEKRRVIYANMSWE